MTLEERCRSIALLLSDVNGVLTDGQIVLDNQGIESKAFHVRDGLGIKLWQKAGYQFGMVTLRSTQSLKVRAAELGIEILRQGVPDKLAALKQILAELKLHPRPRLLHGRRLARSARDPRGGAWDRRGRCLRRGPPGGPLHDPASAAAAARSAR